RHVDEEALKTLDVALKPLFARSGAEKQHDRVDLPLLKELFVLKDVHHTVQLLDIRCNRAEVLASVASVEDGGLPARHIDRTNARESDTGAYFRAVVEVDLVVPERGLVLGLFRGRGVDLRLVRTHDLHDGAVTGRG